MCSLAPFTSVIIILSFPKIRQFYVPMWTEYGIELYKSQNKYKQSMNTEHTIDTWINDINPFPFIYLSFVYWSSGEGLSIKSGFWTLLCSLSSIALIHGSKKSKWKCEITNMFALSMNFAYLISWSHVTKPNWKHFYANGNFRYKVSTAICHMLTVANFQLSTHSSSVKMIQKLCDEKQVLS